MAKLAVENALTEILPSIMQYPAVIQSPLLKYYILYLLKDETKEKTLEKCISIRSQLIALNETPIDNNITSAIDEISHHLGISIKNRTADFEKLNDIHEKLNELRLTLNNVSTENKSDSVSELIFALVQREKNTKKAMTESVEEMFGRLLSPLDPAKAERYLDQSIKRQGIEKKAALYDAMCEKYEQIFDYNKSGLLLKDYRRLFLAKTKSQAE